MVAAEYFYLFAPAGTPISILTQLNAISGAALTDGEFQQKLFVAGFDPLFSGDLTETRVMFESERTRWLPIAKATGLQIN
jgi:tripartite-type tricarboxylate transporter receptor subunit TctC